MSPRWSVCRATRRSTTRERPPEGSSRAPTVARTGSRFSTINRSPPSAPWRWPPPTPTSSGPGRERASSAATSPSATAFTRAPTVARPGSTWGSRPPVGSGGSSSTPPIPTSCLPPLRGTATAHSRSAACSGPRTAARAGSGCCSWTKTPGPRTSPWTPTTLGSCSPASGSSRSTPGAARAAVRAAAFGSPGTAATPGWS